jgi:hypothetical protein
MDNPSSGLIERLVDAFVEGQWFVFAGALMILLVWICRRLTAGRLSKDVQSWISASCALLVGIGLSLYYGELWWNALLVGLFVAPSSSGFWDKLNSIIPKGGSTAVLLILISPCLLGCQAKVGK